MSRATDAAEKIPRYIEFTESLWRETQLSIDRRLFNHKLLVQVCETKVPSLPSLTALTWFRYPTTGEYRLIYSHHVVKMLSVPPEMMQMSPRGDKFSLSTSKGDVRAAVKRGRCAPGFLP